MGVIYIYIYIYRERERERSREREREGERELPAQTQATAGDGRRRQASGRQVAGRRRPRIAGLAARGPSVVAGGGAVAGAVARGPIGDGGGRVLVTASPAYQIIRKLRVSECKLLGDFPADLGFVLSLWIGHVHGRSGFGRSGFPMLDLGFKPEG